jgi:Holliday junction DNA helicase RuvA
MYEYLKGSLSSINTSIAVLDISGVGYKIQVTSTACSDPLISAKEITFYIAEVVREDSFTLYGFLAIDERDLFLKLSSVSGIGPKTALALISHLGIDTFYEAILLNNSQALHKVPGIGKKTAERLILDMRDKVKGKVSITKSSSPLASDALSALLNLGYDARKAQKAIQSVIDEEKGAELSAVIKMALKKL